jgi:hypothetical protein
MYHLYLRRLHDSKSIDVCLASSAEPGEILALRRTMHIAASHSSVVQVRPGGNRHIGANAPDAT